MNSTAAAAAPLGWRDIRGRVPRAQRWVKEGNQANDRAPVQARTQAREAQPPLKMSPEAVRGEKYLDSSFHLIRASHHQKR